MVFSLACFYFFSSYAWPFIEAACSARLMSSRYSDNVPLDGGGVGFLT